jgi:hypothetical protein
VLFSFKTGTVSVKVTIMLITFLDAECLVHHEFIPRPDHTSYRPQKHSATSSTRSSLETASQIIFQYLASSPQQCDVTSSPKHPSGSPRTLLITFDPYNFFLFPRLKITLKGRRTSRPHREKNKHSREAEGQSKRSLPCIN